jgi:8-oxo-dGTP pyrophosphatase MutT (NUDIX family)
MFKKPGRVYEQSGVIPYRLVDNKLEILLVSTRKRKKWVIPKGVIEAEFSAKDSAAKEALQEAGVAGKISEHVIGRYSYRKWMGDCSVDVFALEVKAVTEKYPGSMLRERKWYPASEAANIVSDDDLKRIIEEFALQTV